MSREEILKRLGFTFGTVLPRNIQLIDENRQVFTFQTEEALDEFLRQKDEERKIREKPTGP